ncbi:MAG: hypothetical protein ABIT47_02655 [Candidatus Paceibacterota bacterium]
MKEETEIEWLARMFADSFSSMQKYMDKRFDAIDQRFDGVDGRLDGLESRMEKVEFVVTETNHRLDETNSRIDTIVIPVLEDHSRRIKNLELRAA